MEINFDEMTTLELANFIHRAREVAVKKGEAAINNLFDTLDTLGIRLYDCCTEEPVDASDFYFKFEEG